VISEVAPPDPESSAAANCRADLRGIPRGIFRIDKFNHRPDGSLEDQPFETLEFENSYTNAGGAALLDLLKGTGTLFDNTNAFLGVGDSSTAFAVAQTDLQAASNKTRVAMDATFPSRSGQVMTWKSTFASGVGNFQWSECALFNASSSGTMLSRIVQAMGTKVSGTSWTLTYTITVP
jgi:hypothetical protein